MSVVHNNHFLLSDDSVSSHNGQTDIPECLTTEHHSHNGHVQQVNNLTSQHRPHVRDETYIKTSSLPCLEKLILPGGVSVDATSKSSGVVLVNDDSDSEKELQVNTVSFADQSPQFGTDQPPQFRTDQSQFGADVGVLSGAEPKAGASTEHPMSDSDFSSGASVLSEDVEELPGQMAMLEEQMQVQVRWFVR